MGTTVLQDLAPAKVNLSLRITGRRPDGYHLLDSIVAFTDFGDTVTVEPSDSLSLEVDGPHANGIPTDDGNLILKAAQALAQATGAAIVTDSRFRWRELRRALRPRFGPAVAHLGALASAIEGASFRFPDDGLDIARLGHEDTLGAYPRLMGEVFGYLSRIDARGPKPNWEASVASRFVREHRQAQTLLAKRVLDGSAGRIRCAFPAGGIQDNTVNRLLLMSSSEHHLPSVPMAFFIEPAEKEGNALLAYPPAR